MEWILMGMLIFSIAVASWKIVDRLERIARALELESARTKGS